MALAMLHQCMCWPVATHQWLLAKRRSDWERITTSQQSSHEGNRVATVQWFTLAIRMPSSNCPDRMGLEHILGIFLHFKQLDTAANNDVASWQYGNCTLLLSTVHTYEYIRVYAHTYWQIQYTQTAWNIYRLCLFGKINPQIRRSLLALLVEEIPPPRPLSWSPEGSWKTYVTWAGCIDTSVIWQWSPDTFGSKSMHGKIESKWSISVLSKSINVQYKCIN